ncbi:unnamed protein product [Fraxinus pennsylvanica]|uniref:Uncharacterized protein n=1 Tax=Fraxinus pennsylvanica TaxID=56036 RepID=A0AAD1Z2D4_9LAMI|nr:unnamed protein product [Fraxinus pennsylvanica]
MSDSREDSPDWLRSFQVENEEELLCAGLRMHIRLLYGNMWNFLKFTLFYKMKFLLYEGLLEEGDNVIVDQGTMFVTFTCNKDAVPGLQSYPRPIMSWSSLVYQKVFQRILGILAFVRMVCVATCSL